MTVGTTPRGEDDAVSTEPADEASAVQDADERSSAGMGLLTEGVPLALLADLADPAGPASPAILEDEGLPEVAWWDDADRADDGADDRAQDDADDPDDAAAQ